MTEVLARAKHLHTETLEAKRLAHEAYESVLTQVKEFGGVDTESAYAALIKAVRVERLAYDNLLRIICEDV